MRVLLEQISNSIDISAVRMVLLLPELPLLRFRLVPAFWYFLTFSKIVLGVGGLRSGNLA